MTGRVAIVTGGTAGLGLEVSRALAAAGARVIAGVRAPERAAPVLDALRRENPAAELEAWQLDVADFASVRSFAQRWHATGQTLDLLVHNAGIMATPFEQTRDGADRQMATNHLGPFLLTAELQPSWSQSPTARVVFVTSDEAEKVRDRAHGWSSLAPTRSDTPWTWYGVSKLAGLLCARELADRVACAELPVVVTAAHPGLAATRLSSQVSGRVLRIGVRIAMAVFGQSPRGGSRPIVHASIADDVVGGQLWTPGGLGRLRGRPASCPPPPSCNDAAVRAAVWNASVEATGARWLAPIQG